MTAMAVKAAASRPTPGLNMRRPRTKTMKNGADVGQGRQHPAGVAHVQGVYVCEELNDGPEEDHHVDEDAAQGEPMGVERAALGVQ